VRALAAILAVALSCAAALAEDAIEVRVKPTPGGPAIHVDGKQVVPRFFFGCRQYGNIPDSSNVFFRTVAHCRDAGVKFISFPAAVCWHPPEKGDDWSWLDGICNRIIAVHPEALLVPRIPVNAPEWLMKQHPEWAMKLLNTDGEFYTSEHASVFARDYRDMCAAHFEKLVRHLREKFPRNFAGIHPVGQSYGEFFFIDSLCGNLHGFETPERDAWRRWLAARGAEDAATAEIPTPEERRRRTAGCCLRDPVADRRVVEFSHFEQSALADFVAAIAAACRRGGDGKTLVTFFFGYGVEHVSVPNGAAATGDYAMERLLSKAAGNVDIIASPFSYMNRKYLAPTMTQCAAESVMLRGVLFLDEDDTRTYLVKKLSAMELAGDWTKTTKDETIRQLRSNLVSCITRGRACWWMDLPAEGWYDDRDLWRVMEELRPLDEAMLARKGPFAPEIALLLDERGMLFATANSRVVFDPLIRRAREHFEKCGAPYGQYLAVDALAGRVPAKLQFFTSTFFAGEPTRRAIAAQRKAQPGITRVWCWAPGWLSKEGKSEENMFLTTGFKTRRIEAIFPTVSATPAGKALGFPDSWSAIWENLKIDPLFSAVASGDETLARWPDGSPAVAARKAGAGYEVFFGIPAFTPEVVAGLAKLAGCTLYANPGEAYVRAAEGKVFAEPLVRKQE